MWSAVPPLVLRGSRLCRDRVIWQVEYIDKLHKLIFNITYGFIKYGTMHETVRPLPSRWRRHVRNLLRPTATVRFTKLETRLQRDRWPKIGKFIILNMFIKFFSNFIIKNNIKDNKS